MHPSLLWYTPIPLFWYTPILISWHTPILVYPYPDILIYLYSGIPLSWYPDIPLFWYTPILISWHTSILVYPYPDILIYLCSGIPLSWYPDIPLFWYTPYHPILSQYFVFESSSSFEWSSSTLYALCDPHLVYAELLFPCCTIWYMRNCYFLVTCTTVLLISNNIAVCTL
jgi:hypothetical protein